MRKTGYTRHRWVYGFRAWIDESGSNCDRRHREQCGVAACRHLRLWDLNWNKSGRNIVRVIRGWRYLSVAVGRNYRRFAMGRCPLW